MIDTAFIRQKLKGRISPGESWARHYAVLLLLVDDAAADAAAADDAAAASPRIVYEVRAQGLDRQPGEVCFPGGEIEEGETPLEAALRETEEEMGICADDVEIIDRLVTIGTRAGSHIHCYAGIISEETFAKRQVSEAEVAEVFTVSVDDLMNTDCEIYWNSLKELPVENFPYDKVNSGEAYKWKDGKAPVPVFDVNGRIIWGLTGRMTKEFLEILK